MVGPAQASESETSPPNLSPTSSASSSSSSSSRTPKSVIDNLCTQIADTTLASDSVQRTSRYPFMQGQTIACPPTPRPATTTHSPPSQPPHPLSFGDPMELWKSDGVGGFLPEEEECKTPRGEEYRIPKPVNCPPAPKRSRRHWSERPVCAGNAEEEEPVDSSEVEEALKKKR